jgi:hypothetical protein
MKEFCPNKESAELTNFREEIAKLKRLEEKDSATAHFKKCTPAELKEEDQKIYEKLTLGILTKEEFTEYVNESMSKGNRSQKDFSAYVGNIFTVQMFRKK